MKIDIEIVILSIMILVILYLFVSAVCSEISRCNKWSTELITSNAVLDVYTKIKNDEYDNTIVVRDTMNVDSNLVHNINGIWYPNASNRIITIQNGSIIKYVKFSVQSNEIVYITWAHKHK